MYWFFESDACINDEFCKHYTPIGTPPERIYPVLSAKSRFSAPPPGENNIYSEMYKYGILPPPPSRDNTAPSTIINNSAPAGLIMKGQQSVPGGNPRLPWSTEPVNLYPYYQNNPMRMARAMQTVGNTVNTIVNQRFPGNNQRPQYMPYRVVHPRPLTAAEYKELSKHEQIPRFRNNDAMIRQLRGEPPSCIMLTGPLPNTLANTVQSNNLRLNINHFIRTHGPGNIPSAINAVNSMVISIGPQRYPETSQYWQHVRDAIQDIWVVKNESYYKLLAMVLWMASKLFPYTYECLESFITKESMGELQYRNAGDMLTKMRVKWE